MVPGNPSRGFAPCYHYHIHTPEDHEAGHINFRAGNSPHIHRTAGHIGYVVSPAFRGNNLAYYACRAIAPFIRTAYESVIITCGPGNAASRRIIERLGAAFIDEGPIPDDDPFYPAKPPPGGVFKRRYRWTP